VKVQKFSSDPSGQSWPIGGTSVHPSLTNEELYFSQRKNRVAMSEIRLRKIRKSQSTYRGRVEIREVYLPSQLWSVHHHCLRDDRFSERGWACSPPSPGWANFSIMMECTPEGVNCELCDHNYQNGAVSNQLTNGGRRGGECLRQGDSESFDV
jgi:hypothetical protein